MKNAITGILVTKAMESIGTAVKEIESVGKTARQILRILLMRHIVWASITLI